MTSTANATPTARVTAAGVSALRHAMGLSLDAFAHELGVHPRTVRSWESGRDGLSDASSAAVWALVRRHDALVDRMLDAGVPVAISRTLPPDASPPRGWYLAAAGRAMIEDPDLEVEWT